MLRNEMRISKKGGNNEREHLCDGGEDDEQSKERERSRQLNVEK